MRRIDSDPSPAAFLSLYAAQGVVDGEGYGIPLPVCFLRLSKFHSFLRTLFLVAALISARRWMEKVADDCRMFFNKFSRRV